MMDNLSSTTAIPLLVLAAFLPGCYFVFRLSRRFDNWFLDVQGRRLLLLVPKLAMTAIAAILTRVPHWDGILKGDLTIWESAAVSGVFALSCIVILLDCIQFRQTDTAEQKRKDLETQADTLALERDEAKLEEFFYRWVSSCFLKAVGLKADRFQTIGANAKSVRIDHAHALDELRRVADPDTQIEQLIQIVYQIYHQQLIQLNNKAKLRVAYMHQVGKGLQVRYAWDGTNKPFITSLPTRAKDKFKLTGEPRCCATYAVRDGSVMIIEDAASAHIKPESPFEFCHSSQQSYLRSMLVLPIRSQGDKRHVVCVDTDEVGFFAEKNRSQYEFVREQLEKRLLVELGVERALKA